MDEPLEACAPTSDLAGHEPALLALNNAHAAALSLLDAGRFAALTARAFHAARIGDADAFLLAFDQAAEYDSPNFQWFRRRLPRFVYVDRVVVAGAARGRGLAGRLYADLDARARAAAHATMACEINLDPPNPGSDRFHARLGFREVGTAALAGGGKTVRYLIRAIPA